MVVFPTYPTVLCHNGNHVVTTIKTAKKFEQKAVPNFFDDEYDFSTVEFNGERVISPTEKAKKTTDGAGDRKVSKPNKEAKYWGV